MRYSSRQSSRSARMREIELHDDKGCGSSPGKASGSLPTSWSMAAIAGAALASVTADAGRGAAEDGPRPAWRRIAGCRAVRRLRVV
ncbi:hypothetical protein ACPA9J_27290 [Pseudomonas aeruginosa]